MVNNINIDSKGRYQYYKIDKLLKSTELELVLNVHDFQTKTFVPVKIFRENIGLCLTMEDGTKYILATLIASLNALCLSSSVNK